MGNESRLFMTVPTAGSRPELLKALIENCGLPPQNIILLATRPNLEFPEGCVVVEDLGAPNIQRWWARGIDEAVRRGATAVAVLNDDIRVSSETLPQLQRALVDTGAVIATPSRPPMKDGVHKGDLIPYEPRIWGCLWVVDATTDLRPDESFVWWYGDNDLDIRARTEYNGIVSLDVEYEHMHPGEGTFKSNALVAQTEIDGQLFEAKYARLLKKSRSFVKQQKRRKKLKRIIRFDAKVLSDE